MGCDYKTPYYSDLFDFVFSITFNDFKFSLHYAFKHCFPSIYNFLTEYFNGGYIYLVVFAFLAKIKPQQIMSILQCVQIHSEHNN